MFAQSITVNTVMKDDILTIQSINHLHELLGYEAPKHPLISVIDVAKLTIPAEIYHVKMKADLFCVMLKDADCGFQYGRNTYDFDKGVLVFFGPNQVVSSSVPTPGASGWMLFFHPDLIRHAPLAQSIDRYSFFSYDIHEALHLSAKEENILQDVINKIEYEYSQHIDAHTQNLLITNLELLLNYANRFYERQFHTRSNHHKDMVSQIEHCLKSYYKNGLQMDNGAPNVSFLASEVNLSPNYLSDLLKRETGRTALEHINDFVINYAKNQLLGSGKTINEIAYDLGFSYPHYFSRLFRKKTGLTPQQYRDSSK